MLYVAFVLDVFSLHIVGWRAGTLMRTDLALDALEHAVYDREVDVGLAHRTGRSNGSRSSTRAGRGVICSISSTDDVNEVASELGVHRATVYRRLRRLGVG
jgi:Transcriptional regulator containing PAS, AAA-type ATPase, and DNA-binding domains